MATFVLKTEPSEYSFSDLQRDKRTAWTGVTNATARINLRLMRSGDHAYIYHTGDEKAVVGLAKVVAEAYADPAEAKAGKPTLNGKGELAAPVVDLMPVRAVHPVTLAALKADARFKACGLVTQGRLSVIKLSEGEAKALASLCG